MNKKQFHAKHYPNSSQNEHNNHKKYNFSEGVGGSNISENYVGDEIRKDGKAGDLVDHIKNKGLQNDFHKSTGTNKKQHNQFASNTQSHPQKITYGVNLHPPNAYSTQANTTNSNKNTNKHSSRQTTKVEQKCILCQTPTEKCCSLCRRVFYCSAECQEVDWHTKHKFVCEGRNYNTNSSSGKETKSDSPNNFVIYNESDENKNVKTNNQKLQREQEEKQLDYQNINYFLQLLEQRLVMRAKIINQVSKIKDNTPSIVRESLMRQTQQLVQLSERITKQQYKPSYSHKANKNEIAMFSNEQWGSEVVVSDVVIGLQYLSDLTLMAKIYHIAEWVKQAKQLIISLGKMLDEQEYKELFLDSHDQNINRKLKFNSVNQTGPYISTNSSASQQKQQNSDPLSETKNLILQTIIQLSELYNIDKSAEVAYKLFIKKVEIEQGIWEQIYAYFHMGVWYIKKTYFEKAIKSFAYSLELLESHKKTVPESFVLKADCLYNMGQGLWMMGDQTGAIENMQQCYRVRINGIGKNSMECSFCLFKLAKWYKDMQKWSECLQYLEQCHRIRKMYEGQNGYQDKVEEIRILIAEVYQIIKKEKNKSIIKMQPKAQKYYQQLLAKQKNQEERGETKRSQESQFIPKESVASRLFRDDREFIKFRVIISQQMWDTISSEQAKHLSELIEMTDEKMQKSQAIRLMFESEFVQGLNPEQRELFFKQNQLDQMKN